MQHSTLILFCEECGAANETAAAACIACQLPLTSSLENLPVLPMAPVNIAPPVVREVVAGGLGTSGNQSAPLDFLPGTLLLGRYQIRQEIGRGGFSIVYLAEDLAAQRHLVAIKRIYLHTLTPRQVIDATETFNREIQMLKRLQLAAGVPQFYGSFTDPENWYLLMEYIPGQTLEEYQQKAPGGYLSESETAQIGKKLARILQDLHQTGLHIVFRDVKPANIMITPARKLYLIDFGIARIFKPGQRKDTTPLGSPGYAPPEQYGRTQTDGRADIYSLGATLQTLLTGRDPLELAQGEQTHNPQQPSRKMSKLLAAMLEPEVVRRPATMRVVGQQLRWSAIWGYGNRWRASLSFGVGVILGFLTMVWGALLDSFVLFGLGLILLFVWVGLIGIVTTVAMLRKRAGKPSVDGLLLSIGLAIGVILGIVAIFVVAILTLLRIWGH